jgi:hypothetical protein
MIDAVVLLGKNLGGGGDFRGIGIIVWTGV